MIPIGNCMATATQGTLIADNVGLPAPCPTMSDARFIELETKLAYQEDAASQLSDVVARQQQQIDALETALRILIERVQTLSLREGDKATLAEEVPPHY